MNNNNYLIFYVINQLRKFQSVVLGEIVVNLIVHIDISAEL